MKGGGTTTPTTIARRRRPIRSCAGTAPSCARRCSSASPICRWTTSACSRRRARLKDQVLIRSRLAAARCVLQYESRSSPAAPAISARTSVRALAAAGHAPIIVDDLRCATPRSASADFTLRAHRRARTPAALTDCFARHRPGGRRPSRRLHQRRRVRARCPTSTGATTSAPAPACCSRARATRARFALLVDRGGVRQRRGVADSGSGAAGADVSLRLVEAGVRAPAARQRAGAAHALGGAALLQRRRRQRRAGASARRMCPRSISFRASSPRCWPASRCRIYGNDYPTPDGTCVARLHPRHRSGRPRTCRFSRPMPCRTAAASHVGTGSGSSVLQVIAGDRPRASVSRPRVGIGSRRPGDPASLVADPSALRAALGWDAAALERWTRSSTPPCSGRNGVGAEVDRRV